MSKSSIENNAGSWVDRRVSDWKPARFFPETYPGECPQDSYLLLGDSIFPFQCVHPLGMKVAASGRLLSLDDVLCRYDLPPVRSRYPAIAYGANRNPATLKLKLLNYGRQVQGRTVGVPLIRACIVDADVIAGGLFGQGYFYANLLQRSSFTDGALTTVWVALLDIDQLRAIHDSEGVLSGVSDGIQQSSQNAWPTPHARWNSLSA